MVLTAKQVVQNKFWIIEMGGEKVATLQASPTGLVLCNKDSREEFATIENLTDKYDIVFDSGVAKPTKKKDESSSKHLVNEFPVHSKPYNIVFDIKRQIPLFTKNEKSKSFYCAGYYIIQFKKHWTRSFCPKSITLARYPFKGPFKSKLEMSEQLRIANNE
jgi:hypothetical protein